MNRFVCVAEGVVKLLSSDPEFGPVPKRRGQFWVETNRLVQILEGPFVVLQGSRDGAAIRERQRIAGVEPNRFVKVAARFVKTTLLCQNSATIRKRHRETRVELNGPVAIIKCLGVLARVDPNPGSVLVRRGVIWIQSNRLVQVVKRFCVVPAREIRRGTKIESPGWLLFK